MENQRQATETNMPASATSATDTQATRSSTAPRDEPSTFGSGANTNTNDFPPPPKRQDYSAPPPRADTTSRENPSGHHTGSDLINKVKGVAAQGHGLGENLRGNINAAVDTAFNDKRGQEKDEAIAGKGAHEVINKEFTHDKTPRKMQ